MTEKVYLEINGKKEILLVKDRYLIGRDQSCDIVLTGNMISRKHAAVLRQNGLLCIRDLHSKHGTIVNGKKIDSDTDVPIRPGDEINVVNQARIRIISTSDDKLIKTEALQPSQGEAIEDNRVRLPKQPTIRVAGEASKVVLEFLNVVDSIEYGLKAYQKAGADDPHRKGLQKILEQAQKSLQKMGVKPIDALGKPFDPRFHNAVSHVADPKLPENTVKEVVQTGYMYQGAVLRYASVVVAN